MIVRPAQHLTWVRRGVPESLVEPLARARAAVELRSERRLAVARSQMEFLVGDLVPVAELSSLAVRHLRWLAWRAEYKFHPSLVNTLPVNGIELLQAAQESGSGALVSFVHHGPWDGALASIASAGVALDVVVTTQMYDPQGLEALRIIGKVIASTGNTLINVGRGSDAIRESLAAGRMVAIAHDVIGRTEVEFLERQRLGSAGLAHLAIETGVPVIAMTCPLTETARIRVQLDGPWLPHDHRDAHDLLQRLLDHHADVVRTWPEGYEYPLDRWAPVKTDA